MSGLINTLEAPGEFDALTTLRPNEPYFLLVGRDAFAPDLIVEWADKRRKRALAEFDEGKIDREQRDTELRKCTQAEVIAASMREYKAGHAAVETTSVATAYTGHELPEETKKRDRLQRQRSNALTAVHNAIAELTDLAELVDGERLDDRDFRCVVTGQVECLRVTAAFITPERPLGVAA